VVTIAQPLPGADLGPQLGYFLLKEINALAQIVETRDIGKRSQLVQFPLNGRPQSRFSSHRAP